MRVSLSVSTEETPFFHPLLQALYRVLLGLTLTNDRFPREVTRVLFVPELRENVYLYWPAK